MTTWWLDFSWGCSGTHTLPAYCHGLGTNVPSGVQRQSPGWRSRLGTKSPEAQTFSLILNKLNPMLHANLIALCFREAELWPIEVLHCRNTHFRPFLLLWPWARRDDLHIRTWPVFPGDIPDVWTFYVKSSESYRITARECVHLVTCVHCHVTKWWSHYSIRHIRKPHDTRKPHGSIFYKCIKTFCFITSCKAHRWWHI